MSDKELTTPEIRKLIKAHNVLMSIKIPPKSTRTQIISLIENKGYVIDHVAKKLKPKSRPRLKAISLDDADKILKKPEKTALQKQKAVESKAKKVEAKAKELKLVKKEAVKEFKQKKAEATKKAVNKPVVKKPIKKEDDVRPKDKVGRPRFDPKKIKVIKPKDDKIKIKITKPSGRVDVGSLNKGKIIKETAPPKEEIKKPKKTEKKRLEQKKINIEKIKWIKDLGRIKDIKVFREMIEEFNGNKLLQKKALGKELKEPLRLSDKNRQRLINDIVAYKIYKVIEVDIPAPKKTSNKVETDDERKERLMKQKEERVVRKRHLPLIKSVNNLFIKYRDLLKKNKYKDVKKFQDDMVSEFEDIMEEFDENLGDDDEFDSDIENELEDSIIDFKNQLENIAENYS